MLILGYTSVRFGIFDFIVNVVGKNHYLYIDNTSVYDRLLKKKLKHLIV